MASSNDEKLEHVNFLSSNMDTSRSLQLHVVACNKIVETTLKRGSLNHKRIRLLQGLAYCEALCSCTRGIFEIYAQITS